MLERALRIATSKTALGEDHAIHRAVFAGSVRHRLMRMLRAIATFLAAGGALS